MAIRTLSIKDDRVLSSVWFSLDRLIGVISKFGGLLMHPFCQHVCLCVQIGEIFFLICILIGQIRFEMAQYILCLIIRPYLASLQRQDLRPPAPTVQLHVEHVPPVDDEPLPVRVILPAEVVDGVLPHVRPLGGGHGQAQPRAPVHPLRHRLHEEPRPRLGAVHEAPVGAHGDRLGRFAKRRRDADEPGVHFNRQFKDLQKSVTNHLKGHPSGQLQPPVRPSNGKPAV